jgi:putative polyhydroxyalkanoate system protein
MPKISVAQGHSLPREELEVRVEQYLVKMRDDKMKMVGFDFNWAADRKSVELTGNGFKGNAKVGENEVAIMLDLGLMLSPFKSKVEEGLKRGLEKALA